MLELNKVYQGDCLEVMKQIDDKSVDMILCDLPYGTTACYWDIIIPFNKLWEQYNRIIKRNGAIVLCGTEPFSSYLRLSNIKNYKYDWIWDKITAKGHLVSRFRPMQQTENICVFGLNKINYYPIMRDRPKNKIQYRKIRERKRTEIMGGKMKNLLPKIYDKWFPKTLLTFPNSRPQDILHPTLP